MPNFRAKLVPFVLLVATAARADFTETYDGGANDSDVGWWNLTTQPNRAREIRDTGGASGGYLYNEASTAIPGWSTASPNYQPDLDPEHKQNSPFVGNYLSRGVTDLSVDLNVFPTSTGAWTQDRAVTLILRQMDSTGYDVAFQATSTLFFPTADKPVGWNHFDFEIDATSATVPNGWTFKDGSGKIAPDSAWQEFMSDIDLVTISFTKPGYYYPTYGVWNLGIDNVRIGTQPVPEPTSLGAVVIGGLALLRSRRRP